ncbi:hypothetical protein CIHG_09890 [Coccidioides immitis H538.4]|uniref:Uncharacterized protein n=1 Tax=Coccidioides immitis H538.4 TaxID=396776 RepID=A0A0J8S5D3_COCIT|nr:hypothetical protein CIHG_09890 [Coccidioides immitis H538.4]
MSRWPASWTSTGQWAIAQGESVENFVALDPNSRNTVINAIDRPAARRLPSWRVRRINFHSKYRNRQPLDSEPSFNSKVECKHQDKSTQDATKSIEKTRAKRGRRLQIEPSCEIRGHEGEAISHCAIPFVVKVVHFEPLIGGCTQPRRIVRLGLSGPAVGYGVESATGVEVCRVSPTVGSGAVIRQRDFDQRQRHDHRQPLTQLRLFE